MNDIKRWYDESQKLEKMIKVLGNLSENDLNKIAKYLYQVVNIHWKQKKALEDEVSIGREKLFGYYKAYQKRRWYDKNPSLSGAINILSTLPVKDVDEIVDGFISALRESGLHGIYYQNLKQKDD